MRPLPPASVLIASITSHPRRQIVNSANRSMAGVYKSVADARFAELQQHRKRSDVSKRPT